METVLGQQANQSGQTFAALRGLSGPYATHLPVLRALGAALSIRWVVELGAGLYSTPAFLDHEQFPELEMLLSIEPDDGWREKVHRLVGEDDRLYLLATPPETLMENLEAYQLIFIDDGQHIPDRIRTIRHFASAEPRRAIVVIHDFEQAEYRAAAEFEHCVSWSKETPWTGICWNGFQPNLLGTLQKLGIAV